MRIKFFLSLFIIFAVLQISACGLGGEGEQSVVDNSGSLKVNNESRTGCYIIASDINPDNIRLVVYDSPGADGVWFNADDHVSQYSDYSVEAGDKTRVIGYLTGSDGSWFTADDTIANYTDYTCKSKTEPTRSISYFDQGADSAWLTGDDSVSSYADFSYASGLLSKATIFGSAGSDGAWFNADDVVSTYNDFTIGSSECTTREVLSMANGDILGYIDHTCNENGDTIRSVDYNSYRGGAGADGAWFTADDVGMLHSKYSYNENGVALRVISYSDNGADGVRFTADDTVNSYMDFKHK